MNYFREMHKIKLFIKDLSSYHSKNVFNPWGDFDPDYDISASRTIRRNQLSQYLIQRLESARILVIAEACGYQVSFSVEPFSKRLFWKRKSANVWRKAR